MKLEKVAFGLSSRKFGNCPWKLCIFVAESEDAAKYTAGLTCGMYKDSNPRDMKNMKPPSFAMGMVLLLFGKNWRIT